MGDKLLLVGSVPFDTVEDVMVEFGGALGSYLPALPDGEVGERRSWVNRLCYLLFNGHMDIETLKRPQPVDGVEQLLPRTRADAWQFRVRTGVERVRFGNPGIRLGYARDAVASYFVFRTLREKGILPANLRFQISIPMVNSVVRPLYFPDARDLERVRPGFEESLAAELAVIFQRIPRRDLAIQWDCAWEVQAVSGAAADIPGEGDIATHVAPMARLSRAIPADVQLGFHFCFGTFGGWPAFAPRTLQETVGLANAAVAGVGRRVDWVHIPTLDTVDDAFYAPLAHLDAKGARIYLGAIHTMPTLPARLAVARRFIPEFGLAAYCGFGRTPPSELPRILADHRAALAVAGFA
ncbi:MAG TPA: hypothetical protein VLV50_06100 [Stellaceae bacterium]|nr:hypothetical protein [Stellaceae bacterium]